MARPTKKTPPAKVRQLPVRFTEDLYAVLSENAQKSGLTRGEYIRHLVAGRTPKAQPPIFHDDTALVSELAKLNKLGSNLNQIARYFNEGGLMTNALAKELHHTLQEIDKMVLRCNKELEKEYGSH